MRDVELSAEKGVGDVAEARQIEAELQRVEMRQSTAEVLLIAAEADPLSLDRLFHAERARAGRPHAEAFRVAGLLGRNDCRLVHGQQREEERQRLAEHDVDGVAVARHHAGQRARASVDHVRGPAHVAQQPCA